MGRGRGGMPPPLSGFEKAIYFIVIAGVVIAVFLACG